jgi:hypothetical protein
VNLKNSFDNAKRKIKDNAPVIMASAVAVGSAAVVYTMTRKTNNIICDALYPKGDFSLYLSGREVDKLKSGIPRTTGMDRDGMEVVIATKDMLKDEFLEKFSKLIAKD